MNKYEVKWVYNPKTHNLKIVNSYLITEKKEMYKQLKLHSSDLGKVNRTLNSSLNEWIAHNRLYELGLFKDYCRDCDLTMNESKFRRFCYWILSRFYRR